VLIAHRVKVARRNTPNLEAFAHRRGKNTRHLLTGLLRQSVFGRLAGYEDVNDADRLAHDPAMRAVVDRGGLDHCAASTSQMGRFETGWLTSESNLAASSPGAQVMDVGAELLPAGNVAPGSLQRVHDRTARQLRRVLEAAAEARARHRDERGFSSQ
jgi:hypothetical protein